MARFLSGMAAWCVAFVLVCQSACGQPSGAGGPAGGGPSSAGAGGAANADFDALIDLIVSTVGPETWAENGGGPAEIRPFPTGVWIDPAGVLESVGTSLVAPTVPAPERPAGDRTVTSGADARCESALRCVSLPRLETEIVRRSEAGEPLDEAMLALAGLRRVERVVVFPPSEAGERGDLLLVGPAGDWRVDEAGRIVAAESGAPVPRLDDLLVLLRREWSAPGTPFGCAITPRQEALAATQARLDETSRRPLAPGERRAWLEGVRRTLGPQDIEVFGLDPATNAARVLVEADHHMKRLGLGARDAGEPKRPDGVPSYLDRVADRVRRGEAAEPLSVLRWWFATDYEALARSPDGDAYRLAGQAARVLSENELLTLRGERVHTGRSDAPTQGFADDFTEHFAAICQRWPLYGELRNVFDLAIVAALIRSEELPTRAGWRPGAFVDPGVLPTPRLRHATQVETMATSRVVNRTQILAAVSGGVWIDSAETLGERVVDASLGEKPPRASRPVSQSGGWWWDAE